MTHKAKIEDGKIVSRGPDGDIERFPLPAAGPFGAVVVEDGNLVPGPPKDGACTIRLPELEEATPAEVADLIARIQRVVDEWSSARAGKSVYEHIGRRYGPFWGPAERPAGVVWCEQVCCSNCGATWTPGVSVSFERLFRSRPESYRTAIDGVIMCHECLYSAPMVFGLKVHRGDEGVWPRFRKALLADYFSRRDIEHAGWEHDPGVIPAPEQPPVTANFLSHSWDPHHARCTACDRIQYDVRKDDLPCQPPPQP